MQGNGFACLGDEVDLRIGSALSTSHICQETLPSLVRKSMNPEVGDWGKAYAIVLTWWTWGDVEVEVMENLMRVFHNLKVALMQLSNELLNDLAKL